MRVLGANLGETSYGKRLKDGGACVIERGVVKVAIAEERLSRVKNAGGFQRSAPYCLESLDMDRGTLDLAVLSSCCKSERMAKNSCDLGLTESTRVVTVGHHLAHAY